MNTKMIRYILCRMLGVESVLLMIPVIVAALYQEMSGIAFLIPAGILLLLFFLAGVKKPEQSHIYGKEGMVIVALAWILWSLFGAMPFTIQALYQTTWMRFLRRFPGFTTDRFQYFKRCRSASAVSVVLAESDSLDRRNGSAGVCTGAYIIR